MKKFMFTARLVLLGLLMSVSGLALADGCADDDPSCTVHVGGGGGGGDGGGYTGGGGGYAAAAIQVVLAIAMVVGVAAGVERQFHRKHKIRLLKSSKRLRLYVRSRPRTVEPGDHV
jgi:hypothetical protein